MEPAARGPARLCRVRGRDPSRGQQTATNVEAYEQRVEAWRRRFYRATGVTVGERLGELAASRALIAGDPGLTQAFAELVPAQLGRDVIAEGTENLIRAEVAFIAERFERRIVAAWIARVRPQRSTRSRMRGRGAPLRWVDETLPALSAGRVEQLILDPAYEFAAGRLGSAAAGVLREAVDETVAECALELAFGAARRSPRSRSRTLPRSRWEAAWSRLSATERWPPSRSQIVGSRGCPRHAQTGIRCDLTAPP